MITHLASAWQAEPIGAIDPEDYYDFQVTRPVTEVTDGSTQSLIWPTTRLLTPRKNQVDRDVVLVHGIEPNMRWRRFCAELVEAFAGRIAQSCLEDHRVTRARVRVEKPSALAPDAAAAGAEIELVR